MKKIGSLFIISIVFSVTPAVASNWVEVTRTNDDIVLIDTGSIRKLGDSRKVWVHFENKVADDEGTKTIKQLQTIQCIERRRRIEYFIRNRADGTVVSQMADSMVFDFDDIIPDTIGESIMNFVCSPA